jgi:hypothetical protein
MSLPPPTVIVVLVYRLSTSIIVLSGIDNDSLAMESLLKYKRGL